MTQELIEEEKIKALQKKLEKIGLFDLQLYKLEKIRWEIGPGNYVNIYEVYRGNKFSKLEKVFSLTQETYEKLGNE